MSRVLSDGSVWYKFLNTFEIVCDDRAICLELSRFNNLWFKVYFLFFKMRDIFLFKTWINILKALSY